MAEEIYTNEKKPTKVFMWALLITAIVFFFLGRSCSTEKHSTFVVKDNFTGKPQLIKSDTVVKYVYNTKWYALPQVKLRIDSVFIPVPATVDTAAIIRKFYTEFLYTDSTRDSNILIVNRYIIAENKVISDSTRYKLLKPQIEKTITNTFVAPNKMYLSVGLQIGAGKTNFLFSPELLLTDKKRRCYGVGYDLVNKMYLGKIYIPLKIK